MLETYQVSSWLEHIGFDLAALDNAEQFYDALLGHYRIKQGEYDIDRATNDLATYGPIASEIVRRQQENRKSLAK